MLNELYDLSQSLKSVGIQLESWHPYLKECPRSGRTFGIYLDSVASIEIMRPLNDEQVASLRKYEKSAGNSFPCFNLLPLWCIAGPDGKDRDEKIAGMTAFRKSLASKKPPHREEIVASVRELISQCRPLWIDPNKKPRGRDESDKVTTCLRSVVAEIEGVIREIPKLAALRSLLGRVQNLDALSLHSRLSEYLQKQLESGCDAAVDYFDLLFVGGDKPKSSSFMLEVSDFQNFEVPVNHSVTHQAWSDALFAAVPVTKKGANVSRTASSKVETVCTDAFGMESEGHGEKFPEIKMSRFGPFKLRAMSSESPCQKRYDTADAKSFVVSSFNRQEMKNALEWLSRDERQGKTWRDLTNENGGVATVLFAYTSRIQESPAEIADFLGGDEQSNMIRTVKDFETLSRSVADAVQGIPDNSPNVDVCVFVLTKPDGRHCKLQLSSRFSAKHLLRSASDWELGCRNLPSIKIRQFVSDKPEKGVKPELLSPLIPFPMQLLGCISTVWRRLGSECSPTKSVHIADALSLLLDSGKELESTATPLLRLLLKNTTGLLLATGQAAVLGRVHSVAKNLQKHQLLLPSILGLLLRKLGYSKEIYMKTGAFWVGRFLSAIDQLHCLYCEDVRDGSFPPQFVGNAMMTAALSNPENALSQLADRAKPYLAWAKTNTGDKMKLAKYWLGQLAIISNEISEQTIPSRCTDADRAAMLIGYLSRPEKENKEGE